MQLNVLAADLALALANEAAQHRLAVHRVGESTVIDCGSQVPGGLQAGCRMAEICLSGLGKVQLVPCDLPGALGGVQVQTDHPVPACMASQYAGWQIAEEKFFAMGSGPMRAAAGKEELFNRIGLREDTPVVVGVLETGQLPTLAVCEKLATACRVPTDQLILLFAPTASLAGTVQIVARSVETALHKLDDLGFDLSRIVSGMGTAPLPPVAKNDLAAIGRTNDAILYGAVCNLWVRGDDASLEEVGPKIPSAASADYGAPFAQIFERYDHDFYKIDPHLFSPAVVQLNNLESGKTFRFGQLNPDVLQSSFG